MILHCVDSIEPFCVFVVWCLLAPAEGSWGRLLGTLKHAHGHHEEAETSLGARMTGMIETHGEGRDYRVTSVTWKPEQSTPGTHDGTRPALHLRSSLLRCTYDRVKLRVVANYVNKFV